MEDHTRVPPQVAELMIGQGLVRLISMEHDFDETVQVALTEKDIGFLACALPAVALLFPGATDLSEEIQIRILELVRAQHPEWLDERKS